MKKEHRQEEDKDRGLTDQLKAHSLPGINQAGKGPDACDDENQGNTRDGGIAPRPDGKKQP